MNKLIIDFGQYSGKDIDSVPASYVLYEYSRGKFSEEIRKYIETNIDKFHLRCDYEIDDDIAISKKRLK